MEDEDKEVEVGLTESGKKSKQSHHSSDSDSSLLLSPLLLPESVKKDEVVEGEPVSDCSSISEHLNSITSGSVENDRSDQEIEISNQPSFSLRDDVDNISQEVKPFSSTSSESLHVVEKLDNLCFDVKDRVHSILDEILRSEQFKSDSERTLHKSEISLDSNDNSFNVFGGVNLNDSLINYDAKARDKSANSVGHLSLSNRDSLKVKQLEEIVVVKDNTIAALAAELESLREITSSNQSTLSINTSATDYKLYQDEFQNKIVEYQNALSHRDTLIQQLTEALQQSVANREQLQQQSIYFSKEILTLQNQLAKTTEFVSNQKWNLSSFDVKDDSLKSTTNTSIQNEDVAQEADEESSDKSVLNYETQCSKLEDTLNVTQISLMNDLKNCINTYVQQKVVGFKNAHESELDKFKREKMECENEISRLKQLLTDIGCDSTNTAAVRTELERKHAKEMEELRTYFEKKCADLEKNYSEEVFSQQSRKLSNSSASYEDGDFMFTNPSGPGGDTVQICVDATKYECSDLSKNDVIKLKKNLAAIALDLNKYNVENISKDDLASIKLELNKYDFRSLLKYDLSLIKAEIQNKYHAELEILREDYENRIDALNVENDNRLQSIERKYVHKMESLKFDLDEALRTVDTNVSTAVQEVVSSGEFELAEVVTSYERRLQEQVTMAKIDIITALEQQIQMLVANTAEDAEWPSELLQLRNRFTEQYEDKIMNLNDEHEEEITKLKEEHRKILNGALERARRRSLKDDSLTQSDLEIIKERDSLKKTTSILRHLIGELMTYFSKCEDELNNTIVEELLKHGFDKNLTEIEAEINLNDSSNSTCSDTNGNKKRVHFAPNFNELMATIDSSTPSSLDSNISLDLKNELGACLKRLRDDANSILAASTNVNKIDVDDEKQESLSSINVLQDKVAQLVQQLDTESEIKKDLTEELAETRKFADSLEIERTNLETHVEHLVAQQKVLEGDLRKAREKIAEFVESGHKEMVSEGYGQNSSNREMHNLSSRIATLAELQERVRGMVAETTNRVDHPLLQLVDELCREGDRITEEAKSDHEDLQQQIEAADKKLRATCHFLEEQASEREQERDEAQKQIASLQEQLRDREKDRVSCERINKEIEQLEQQMREMSKLMDENEKKTNEIEAEKQEAIEKIYVLRDIIRDLETQVELKTNSETELQTFITQLEEIIKQQNKTNAELTHNLSSIRNNSDSEDLQEIIKELEKEIKTLKINLEFAGSEGLFKQMKTQLNEFEISIDKRTRDLEALHSAICATSCSSPSEDMSLRDQIRPKTPSALDECDVPLQQLARLKEKLVKHSRAEDAAVKRIRDLEMELVGLRHDLDDVQNERDILQDQVSEQLILVSSLQMRLDDQRLRAEHVQKQNNTSLELRIYDLENEVKNLVETVNVRDKTIKQLNKVLEETKKRLGDREQELDESFDEKVVSDLNNEIQKLRVENASLLTKINNDAQNAQVLPNLVDNILADKNKDIDLLREKLDKTQSELNSYLSLNLDLDQLKTLSRLPSSERAFADILSLIDLDPSQNMRMAAKTDDSLSNTFENAQYKRNVNETMFLGSNTPFEPEISSIENLRKPQIHYSVEAPLTQPNSTKINKTSEKKVHFNDTVYNDAIEKLQSEIADLKKELSAKDELVHEYSERLDILKGLEATIEELQKKLDSTETSLQKATNTFEKEQVELKEVEKNLRIDLAEKKMFLIEKEKELKLLEDDSTRKDQMYVNLAKEKRDLEKALNELKDNNERYKELDSIVGENENEIEKLRQQLGDVEQHMEKIRSLESQLNAKEGELEELRAEYSKLREEVDSKSKSLKEYQGIVADQGDLNLKMQKEISNKESQLKLLNEQVEGLKKTIETKDLELQSLKSESREEDAKSLTQLESKIKELKDVVVDRETEIEILNEDITRYQDDLAKLENKLKNNKKISESGYELKLAQNEREMAAKELKIVKLVTDLEDASREINHLKQLVSRKDKIVTQMSDDTKSLHVNLETIQSKIQETGNVIDLKRRLEDEQELNRSLQHELSSLKSLASLEQFKPIDMSASIEEITGEVKKQLEYSEHLDSNILTALGSCENLGSLAESNDVELLKQTLSKEMYLNRDLKKTKEELEAELGQFRRKFQLEQEKAHHFENVLEEEKRRSNVIQLEDANMLEQLRIRLECALENQTEYEKLLEKERQTRQTLETQIEHLKSRITNLSSGENSKTELTEYKSLPNLQSQELIKLKSDFKGVQDENVKLKGEVKSLKRGKSEVEASLKCTEDMLRFRNEESKKLKDDIDQMRKAELEVREKLILCQAELEQRNTEIENSRILMGELEQDRKDLKKVIEKLNDDLVEAETKNSNMQEEQLQMPVPEVFLNKLKELSNSVKEFSRDNRHMAHIIEKLTDERKALQIRISEAEQMNTAMDDPVGKVNHLFARFLRSESYRKALMWQKKYLVTLLATYQTYPVFSKEFPIPNQTEPIANHQTRSNGRQRFKAVVISVVSIIRMQFLVRRWNSGKRAFRTSRRGLHRIPQPTSTTSPYLNAGAQFQVGQPVSSQNFPVPQVLTPTSTNVKSSKESTNDNHVFIFSPPRQEAAANRYSNNQQESNIARPRTPPNLHAFGTSWSGATPPSKDKQSRINTEFHSEPLQAPALLTQFLDRFDKIQHRLGVAVDKNSS